MPPAEKQHKKIMCSHTDGRTPETFESQAIRFEDAARDKPKLIIGWLAGYYQVQIDHSEN